MRLDRTVMAVVAGAVLVAGAAFAEPKGGKKGGSHPGGAAAMPADQQAAMAAMMKYATPTEQHKKLDAFVGKWTAKARFWMAPGAPPMESTGTTESKWVLGGRWVEEEMTSTMMGQPFSGRGFTGYDNGKGKYVSMWMDTSATGVIVSEGTMDGKKLTMTGEAYDPVHGKPGPTRFVTTIDSDTKHTLEMFAPGPDGKEMRMMEVVYTKK